jgi:hypothetical protein
VRKFQLLRDADWFNALVALTFDVLIYGRSSH